MKILIVTASILFFTFLSCSSGRISEPFPYGSYSYKSYNFLGGLVGEGTVYISQPDSNIITGNWRIRRVSRGIYSTAQFGDGFLIGYMENDTMRINLNPDDTDIDSELIGEFGDGSFKGDWKLNKKGGLSLSGTFKAVRH